MSTIEQFSLGSIILWQFTPFLMSAVINGELHSNKKFKKKIPTTLARARLYRGRIFVAHHRFKKTTCSSSLQKQLIGNYESKKHIHKLYAMRSGRNVLARFQTENDFRHFVQHKKIRKNVCWRKLGHISLRTWGRYFFLKCFPQDMHSCSFVRFPPWREPMWFKKKSVI